MRPSSLRLFDGLFWAGILLGLLNLPLSALLADRRDALYPAGFDAMPTGMVLFSTLIAITLWYLVSRLRMQFLKWVMALLVVVGLTSVPARLALGLDAVAAIGLLASLCQAVAILFLFRGDAKAWFATPRG